MAEFIAQNIVLLVSLFVMVCLSAFFAAAETAFTSLNKIRLKSLAEKSKGWRAARARLALKLLDSYDKVLSTVLIGTNVVNIAASALATALFISIFGSKGVGLATLVMTILLVVFGDISPKTLAKETPETTALRSTYTLKFFMIIFMPVVALMAAWQRLIIKIFTVKQDRSTTDDEILTYMEEVRQEGVISSNEEKMIRQVIELDDQKVSGILTPRVDVIAVQDTSTTEEIDSIFRETGFSRLPVFHETLDNITGIVLLKDFYLEVMSGKKTFEQIIKPVLCVPSTVKIPKLFRKLLDKKSHMAVIVDEYGGTIGIVTIEDIVEELVGEIWDEHDEVVEPIKKLSSNNYRVLGSVNFQHMLEAADVKFDDEDTPDTTIANWCMETLGRLPRVGEKLEWNNLSIRVNRIVRQRILEVRVTVLATATA